jgi:hypothetical protein
MPDIDAIESLQIAEIRNIYYQLFDTSPPPKSRKEFLIGNICWALQAKSSGKPFSKLREQLINQISNKTISSKTKYMTGTRIIREWKGVTHEVIVEEAGFRWQKQNYKSLSHIAREITGTRWSGPRFFGIKASTDNQDV